MEYSERRAGTHRMNLKRSLATIFLLGGLGGAARCSAASPPPLPGTYGLDGACVGVDVPGGSREEGVRWCVDVVTVAPNGDLELLTSWTASMGFLQIEKGADAGNRKMYLEDDRGRRYDHYETTEAARYGGRLDGHERRLQGSFFFRAKAPGSSSFVFRDDDQSLAIRFALDTKRSLSLDERAAVVAWIRGAQEVEIEDSWGGLGRPRNERWRLRREGSTWRGDGQVSEEVMKEFLERLEQAYLTRGAYVPRLEWTDDYPSLSIRLVGGDQTVEFSTESQGDGHVPWKVVWRGETLIVRSDHPARALARLKSVLTGQPSASSIPPGAPERGASDGLRVAAQSGDVEKMRALLATGADANAASAYDGATPVLAAVLAGKAESIPVLAATGARIDETTARGRPLAVALMMGWGDVVRALLAAGADPSARPGEPAPLLLSIEGGDVETVRALLERGADASGEGTLTAAALTGIVPIARLLLAKGASLEGANELGLTPLGGSAYHGHEEMLDFLLSSGAKVNARDGHDMTALHAAARNAQLGAVTRLLGAGASPDAKTRDGETPLLSARSPRVVAALLRAGADPNAAGAGTTPLVAAAASFAEGRGYLGSRYREGEPNDPLATLKLLIDARANVNAADAEGRTALMAAAQRPGSELQMIRALIGAGADPNRQDAKGRSALRVAVEAYDPGWVSPYAETGLESVRALLAAGALDRPEPDGRTALEVAKQKHTEPLAALLGAARPR